LAPLQVLRSRRSLSGRRRLIREVHLLVHIPARTDFCSPARGYTRSTGHREHAVVRPGEELRVQKRGEDGVQGLGIETEQAPGLGRRELETGHLEVFPTDSAQQFCKRNIRAWTRGHNGPPLRKELWKLSQ
jgi:hypothetical protein